MAKAYASGVVPAAVEDVWAVVQGFDDLPSWHPAIEASEIVEGTDNVPGAVRTLQLAGGMGQVSERLLAVDIALRTFTYAFTDPGPFATRSYVSTVHLAPIGDGDDPGGQTFMEWYADFDSEAADEQGLSDTFGNGVFRAGIDALKKHFGG